MFLPTSIGTISLPPLTTAAALASLIKFGEILIQKLQEILVTCDRAYLKMIFAAIGETNVIPA